MDINLVQNTSKKPRDVIEFVSKYPTTRFDTIKTFSENFYCFIDRLYDNNFIALFEESKNIKGLCCWYFLSDEDSRVINKCRWILPFNIVDGNVLYVALCILSKNCNIWRFNGLFKNLNYYEKANEVLWFGRTWYRKGLRNENSELRACFS